MPAAWSGVPRDRTDETITGLKDGNCILSKSAVNGVLGPAVSHLPKPAIRKIDGALSKWLGRFGRHGLRDTAGTIRQRLEEGPQRTRLIVGGRNLTSLFAPREESSAESAALMRPPESGETAMDRMRYADGVGFAGGNTPAGASAMDGFGGEPGSRAGYDVGFEVGMENGRVVSARDEIALLRNGVTSWCAVFYHDFCRERKG